MRITELSLQVTPHDPANISFVLLQGHIKQLIINNQQSQQLLAHKMDLVLFQLYTQFYQMQKQYFQSGTTTKQMLQQCNQIMAACKEDRQELYKISEDRLRLVKQLKETTDQTFVMMKENEELKNLLRAQEDLNKLLNTRYYQMEDQINSLTKDGNVKESIKALQTEYTSIFKDNFQIQKQFAELEKQTSKLKEFSLPIRVINVAFRSNNSLRELVIRQAEKQLGDNQQLRQIFLNFNFELQLFQ